MYDLKDFRADKGYIFYKIKFIFLIKKTPPGTTFY